MSLVKKAVKIRDDQNDFLAKHESVNLSGLLRECLDNFISQKLGSGMTRQDPPQPTNKTPQGDFTK